MHLAFLPVVSDAAPSLHASNDLRNLSHPYQWCRALIPCAWYCFLSQLSGQPMLVSGSDGELEDRLASPSVEGIRIETVPVSAP